ncbi:MAG TPA: glycosyltransferase family 39 protein [Solirubrobacteraceae bacterium]
MIERWRRRGSRPRAPLRRGWALAEPHERRFDPRYGVAVAIVVAVAAGLRLWGNGSGLPWSYNVDEAQHFVPFAIAMLHGNLDPGGYFANPPAYTYVLAAIFKLAFGTQQAHRLYRSGDSTQIWIAARVASAALGTIAVWLLYLAGARLFDRRTGLIACAIMAVAFLPVFYGKLALNDSPTLAPVCLSLWGSAGIARLGRKRDFVIAGLGLGLAAATKYTGGIVVVPLIVAAFSSVEAGRRLFVALWLPLAGVIALAAFVAANPYSVVDFHRFLNQLAQQSNESGEGNGKLGLTHGSGVLYYLWSLSWGVGWIPGGAAVLGALALLVRRWWWTFAALVPAALGYLAFMGLQGRYFGRWVMPIIPLVCLLAAFAAVSLAELLARGRPRIQAAVLVVLAAALCVQGGFYSVHSGIVNSRPDTRAIARAWLLKHVPKRSHIVVEPIVLKGAKPPDNWTKPWTALPDLLTHRGRRGILYVDAGKEVKLEDYERTLSPALVGLYQRDGYCYVVTGSTEEGRALADPKAVPNAVAYYRALAKAGKRVLTVSPLENGKTDVGFNFDWSFDYYPADYSRPGPLVDIYHLRGGACTAHHAKRRGHAHARRKRHGGARH